MANRELASVLTALLLSMGCGVSPQPLQPPWVEPPAGPPPSTPPPPPSGPPLPAPAFPRLARPGVIYDGPDDLYDVFIATQGSRVASRYVFYDDSIFWLQLASEKSPLTKYTGRYARHDSSITLTFDAWSISEPWVATSTLIGDLLSVRYNADMRWSDFIDGVYVRSKETQ